MKGFYKWMKENERLVSWQVIEGDGVEHIYKAGAEEMRKSIRCEICIGHVGGVCEQDGFMYGKQTPNNFGCIHHQERGTE